MIRLGRAITTTEVCSLSGSLRGRVGVGVPPQNALVERIDFPPSAALRRAIARWGAIAEAQLRRSIYFRTAADGGLCSPASGRGEANSLIGRSSQNPSRFRSANHMAWLIAAVLALPCAANAQTLAGYA